jgi:hypothetical protein
MKISNNGVKIVIGVLAGWIVATVAIWLFGAILFAEVDGIITISFTSLMIIASIALSGSFLLVLGGTYKFSSSMGKVWMLLSIGMFLWLAGEIIYFSYDLQGIEPFPSIADYFYYIAYLPLTVGLVIQMRMLKVRLVALEIAVVVILSVLSGLAIVYFVLWPAFEAFIAEPYDPIVLFAGTMYTVLDIVLLVFVFIVAAKLRHGKINSAWILVLTGLILTTVADSLYWIADNQGIDEMFNWYDLAFLAGYLLIAMGAIKGINVISTSFSL